MKFKFGDRVAFSAKYLKATQQYSGEKPFRRGTVISTTLEEYDPYLVTIEWDGGKKGSALSSNLVHVDRIHLEAH